MRRRYGFVILAIVLILAACTGEVGDTGPAGPAGPAGAAGAAGPAGADGAAGAAADLNAADLSCTECHNDTSIITGKKTAWDQSVHGSGHASSYAGGRGSCAGCHSGAIFSEMVAAGLNPTQVEEGDDNPTHQDCRTCHQVHTSFTGADWALETEAPVGLFAFDDGATFDGGKGNLCGVCHQPRRSIAEADADGNIEVTSTHWGPHHGPQTAMLLGIGGAGDVSGSSSSHYNMVADTCVSCHVGEAYNHTFGAVEASCVECHGEDFDYSDSQAEVQALLDELLELLEAKGMYEVEDGEGHPVVGFYPAAEAQAMWNYIFISAEDSSLGIHNPSYTRDLLEASIAAMGG
jgi:hypothetical protein